MIGHGFLQISTRVSLSLEVDPVLRRQSEILEGMPQAGPEDIQNLAEPQTGVRHRRHLSACGSIQGGVTTTSNMDSR